MKYITGTEFHTYETKQGEPSLEFPMYGIVDSIDGEWYVITWKYKNDDGNFSARYTEESIKFTVDHFNKGPSFSHCRIKTPIEHINLDEDLFTI